MFRRSPSDSRPVRKKWHPDDEETVLHDGLDDSGSPAGDDHSWEETWVEPAAHMPLSQPEDRLEGAELSQAAPTLPDEDGFTTAAPAAPPPTQLEPAPAASSRPRRRFSLPRRRPPTAAPAPATEVVIGPAVDPAIAPVPPYASQAAPPAEAPADSPQGQDAGLRGSVRWGWVFLPLAMLGLAASWFALPIREVAVSGNQHLSAEAVVRAAGVGQSSGWLYYGARQAAGLTREPWIESAEVVRQFPGRLSIRITERRPYAVLRESGRQPVAVARDGTHLPGAALPGTFPTVSGWGPERTGDALAALEALAPYHVQSVEYTPSGLAVKSTEGSAWSGDLESLLKYAGALAEYPNQQIHIYPWGVSVQE
ncbi:cell division protein FtsQ/DivIB [Deinococcus sp. SL84]|uniref:cell division protein FtsQ/DivIB n=1 Tax=Deinococcus sp. SL84 TaxID=2994663 RepID=UPI0022763648|nr:FtsQ-type POTRA domain-containing protein [Deinococcus sp. SL84]MCY1703046.1 FtsQ-type POTRA domain-containing protein [Deinococcus sp. SL84]